MMICAKFCGDPDYMIYELYSAKGYYVWKYTELKNSNELEKDPSVVCYRLSEKNRNMSTMQGGKTSNIDNAYWIQFLESDFTNEIL